jgi:N-methylhydantoinase A
VAPADRGTARIAMLRYHGQGGELTVPWGGDAAKTERVFTDAHQALYGFTLEAPIELVTLRVEATGRMPEPVRPMLGAATDVAAEEMRPVHFASGMREVPVIDRARLGAGARFSGPAIVTQLDATTLVAPGWRGEMHRSGGLLLTREA